MKCIDCDRNFTITFTLPDGSKICPPCLHKKHLRLIEDYNKLVTEFLDFLLKKQQFLREKINDMYKMRK